MMKVKSDGKQHVVKERQQREFARKDNLAVETLEFKLKIKNTLKQQKNNHPLIQCAPCMSVAKGSFKEPFFSIKEPLPLSFFSVFFNPVPQDLMSHMFYMFLCSNKPC